MAAEVFAAGLVIYRKLSGIEYLLLQASYGIHHWTPPKGHAESNEETLETAYRETEEEAGIARSSLRLTDHSETVYYNVIKKGVEKRKAVTYFLAELVDQSEIKLSDEHQDYKWVPLEEACRLADFEEMIKVLRNCDNYLQKQK